MLNCDKGLSFQVEADEAMGLNDQTSFSISDPGAKTYYDSQSICSENRLPSLFVAVRGLLFGTKDNIRITIRQALFGNRTKRLLFYSQSPFPKQDGNLWEEGITGDV